jgi:tetratricopeptide (TPR) repeat protein
LSLQLAQSFSSFLSFNFPLSAGRYQECLVHFSLLLEGLTMSLRRRLLLGCLLCAGCHSLGQEPGRTAFLNRPDGWQKPSSAQSVEKNTVEKNAQAAIGLWQQGQSAMREGHPELAIRCYEQSLAADASLTRNYLSLAAACLECGKEDMACDHLGKYVAGHPDQLACRAHHAELLFKLKRLREARIQFERFTAEAQEKIDKPARLVHAFSRLMDIALAEGNAYEEHLYRGVGLYLLGRRRAELVDPDGDLPASSLLCKAAFELKLANDLRPREARPCWYLYSVWRTMGKQQPAQHWLRCTLDNASFAPLTAAEERGLHLASQCLEKRL